MTSMWFMLALAGLQTACTVSLLVEGKWPLGAVYACYALSNVFLIFVARN